jgi:hypothetical protein
MTPRKKKPSALLWLALGSCGDAPVTYEPEPYEGEAYPDLTAPIVYPARAALVTNSLGDTISVLDVDTMTLAAERPVGRNPVDVDGPHHVTVDEARGVGFIALSYPTSNVLPGPHATHGSSTTFGWVQKLSLDSLEVLGQARVDPNPGDIVLSPDGRTVVVSHFDLQRAIDNPTDLELARARLAVIAADTIGTDALDRRYVTTCSTWRATARTSWRGWTSRTPRPNPSSSSLDRALETSARRTSGPTRSSRRPTARGSPSPTP